MDRALKITESLIAQSRPAQTSTQAVKPKS
jgi:hypothetical protein